MSDQVIDFLEHFGIKGMKWGVRRSRGADGTVGGGLKTKSKTEIVGDKAVTTTKVVDGQIISKGGKKYAVKQTKASELSNAELKAFVERAKLEQQYNQMTKQSAPLTRGQRFVEKMKDVPMEIVVQQSKNALNRKIESELASRALQKRMATEVGKTAGRLGRGVAGPVLTKL